MSKELPYFRFTVSEWLNDDISMEPLELKGLFIDVCSFYWFRDCSIAKALLERRFSDAKSLLQQLYSKGIIKLNDDDTISIKFLDEQYDLLSEKHLKRQKAGKLGGLKKSSNAKAMLKQCSSYKDKDNNKDKDKNIPTLSDFLDYARTTKLYVAGMDAEIENKYDAWMTNGWKDGNDKPIKNWKSKLLQTLPYFKRNNKQKDPFLR